jgi:hypothetical protein
MSKLVKIPHKNTALGAWLTKDTNAPTSDGKLLDAVGHRESTVFPPMCMRGDGVMFFDVSNFISGTLTAKVWWKKDVVLDTVHVDSSTWEDIHSLQEPNVALTTEVDDVNKVITLTNNQLYYGLHVYENGILIDIFIGEENSVNLFGVINGNSISISNIIISNFFNVDSDVPYSWRNNKGYQGDNPYIMANINNKSASPCLVGDNVWYFTFNINNEQITNIKLNDIDITANTNIVHIEGTSAFLNRRLRFTKGVKIYNLLLNNRYHFPIVEGKSTWIAGNDTLTNSTVYASITNGTYPNIWGLQSDYHYITNEGIYENELIDLTDWHLFTVTNNSGILKIFEALNTDTNDNVECLIVENNKIIDYHLILYSWSTVSNNFAFVFSNILSYIGSTINDKQIYLKVNSLNNFTLSDVNIYNRQTIIDYSVFSNLITQRFTINIDTNLPVILPYNLEFNAISVTLNTMRMDFPITDFHLTEYFSTYSGIMRIINFSTKCTLITPNFSYDIFKTVEVLSLQQSSLILQAVDLTNFDALKDLYYYNRLDVNLADVILPVNNLIEIIRVSNTNLGSNFLLSNYPNLRQFRCEVFNIFSLPNILDFSNCVNLEYIQFRTSELHQNQIPIITTGLVNLHTFVYGGSAFSNYNYPLDFSTNINLTTVVVLRGTTQTDSVLTMPVLQQVMLDLASHNTTNGTLNYGPNVIPPRTLNITDDVLDAYNELINRGWTITGGIPA